MNFLVGNIATSPLSPGSLAAFLALIPDGWNWARAGIGKAHLDGNAMAVACGGHVRVGLEERPIAPPAVVRERLGLTHPVHAAAARLP